MIDLSKLSPAPFTISEDDLLVLDADGRGVADYGWRHWGDAKEDAEFHALARNAFDVMRRRGWVVQQIRADGPWMVCGPQWSANPADRDVIAPNCWPDPFTALVEADRWYTANVEAQS